MGRLRGAVAHNVSATPRTVDVLLPETTTFSDLLLNPSTLKGLHSAGFVRPSPIQRSAIPVGRCGTDLIVQAKSGTGKTLVFSIIALEMLDLTIFQLQVLIVAPTREIAVQIKEVLTSISSGLAGLKVEAFIGGLSISADVIAAKTCHVAVGTPGRIKQLVTDGILRLRSVRLFVLDEADRLVSKSFLQDVRFIFSRLPESKQTIVASATFPPEMEEILTRFLVYPKRVNASADSLLLGLRQFVALIPSHASPLVRIKNKTARLLHVLSSFSFRQCFVFCNMQSRMENICRDLANQGWPALHLSGSMPQAQRLATVAALQNHRCRILLTTDLTARGVDAEHIDLVVNLDLAYDAETYLHRIGRAGRFGASAIAVNIIEDGQELTNFRTMLYKIGGPSFNIWQLPDGEIPIDVWKNENSLKTITSIEKTPPCKENIVKPQTTNDTTINNQKKKEIQSDECLKEIIKSCLPKLSKDRNHFSYKQLEEMFKSNTSLPNNLVESSSEESLNEEILVKAFELLNVDGKASIKNKESNSCYGDDVVEIICDEECDDDVSFNEEEDEEFCYDEEEEINCDEGDDESCYDEEEEISCDERDEESFYDEEEEISCGDEDIISDSGCDSYENEWSQFRNNLLMKRLCLQSQLYIQEMLRK